MSASASQSGSLMFQKQRQRGNIYYKSARSNVTGTLRISRLNSALACYQNALSCADSEEEEVSAMESVAQTSWKLAVLHMEKETKTEDIQRSLTDALRHYCMAYGKRFCMSLSWGCALEKSWDSCLAVTMEWLATFDMKRRLTGLKEILGRIPDCWLKGDGYFRYTTLLFDHAMSAWRCNEFMECARHLKDCEFPLKEAERLCQNHSCLKTEINVLSEDIHNHLCVAESRVLTATGDSLLKDVLNEESLNTSTLDTAIGHFKKAASLCQDRDSEQAAIAYSRLGRVYGKILDSPFRGNSYYKQAVELALSISPRNFHGAEWYMEARDYVEEFQRQISKEEVINEERMAALKEMKDEMKKLKKLDETNNGDEDFVKELYKTWPPKTPSAQYEEGLSKKKMLVKAISHYHPDKVDKELHGTAWFYFSGEITKILNNRFSKHKHSNC